LVNVICQNNEADEVHKGIVFIRFQDRYWKKSVHGILLVFTGPCNSTPKIEKSSEADMGT